MRSWSTQNEIKREENKPQIPSLKTRGKGKHHKKMNGYPINITLQRADVVLKTILRVMRKTYLEEFNTTTGYMIYKRRQPNEYLLSCLKKYSLKRFLLEPSVTEAPNRALPTMDEMVFALGSLFYPKILKTIE